MTTRNDAIDALAEMLLPSLQTIQTKQFGRGFKHNASGTPQATGYTHGPGGNLSFPGVDPAVFHTTVGNRGIMGQLPAMPSRFMTPVFQVMTGVKDITGSEKSAVCDNAPTAGLMKTGMLASQFGRYERATPELELNRLGQFNDRADPMDLTLIGSPIDQGGPFAQGPRSPQTPGDLFLNEIARKMWELNVAFHRQLSQQLWIGNPKNNAAQGGYKELTGLDLLINTGHVDAETGISLPSIDSDVMDFNYESINTATGSGGGKDLVNALSYQYNTRRSLAERTGVMPVRWVFAMTEALFWEVTAVWPCAYLTYRCQTVVGSNERVTIDAQDQVRFRDEMRAGRYLLLNGERIEVAIDDGIAMLDGNSSGGHFPKGCFASDIYLIPMSVVGGRASLYLEYLDYGNPSLDSAFATGLVLGRAEGAFLIWPRQLNQCIVFQSKIEPRLVLRTPWLAARLKNVVWCPTEMPRQPFPSQPYFIDGGKVNRPGPSYYDAWKT